MSYMQNNLLYKLIYYLLQTGFLVVCSLMKIPNLELVVKNRQFKRKNHLSLHVSG